MVKALLGCASYIIVLTLWISDVLSCMRALRFKTIERAGLHDSYPGRLIKAAYSNMRVAQHGRLIAEAGGLEAVM